MRRTDPLILGGGPAGSAAGIMLARAGARPLILERSHVGRDIVCGGFLGWDALTMLQRLGVSSDELGAHPISRLRLAAGARVAEANLPHTAAGLSRRTLDAALLERAITEGAGVDRGVAVRAIDAADRRVRLADGGEIEAESVFLATGKHDLRGAARRHEATVSIGLRVRLAPSPALRRALTGVIELHLFADGYAGLLLQEDGDANLCLSISPARLAKAGGRPEDVITALAHEAPLLAERFGAGERGDWLAIAGVPYGWRARATTPGLFRLGDQAAVISSLAGDGVAIALSSGRRAAETWAAGDPGAAMRYQKRFSRHARCPLATADGLRGAAERPGVATAMIRLLRYFPALASISARLTRIGS